MRERDRKREGQISEAREKEGRWEGKTERIKRKNRPATVGRISTANQK